MEPGSQPILLAQTLVSSMSTQMETVNSILSEYGITMRLARIKLHSDECENCIEYVYVLEFKSKALCDRFREELRKLSGGTQGNE